MENRCSTAAYAEIRDRKRGENAFHFPRNHPPPADKSSKRTVGVNQNLSEDCARIGALQRTWLMRTLFRGFIQNLDGRENTEPNARGVLPDLMKAAGFKDVKETMVFPTPSGSISLYRGDKS